MARHPERLSHMRTLGGSGFAAIAVLVTLAAGLAACTGDPGGGPSGGAAPSSRPTTTSTPDPTPTAESGPAIVSDGTAADNLPLFTAVTEDVWASSERVSGRAYIDALVAAGFDKEAMQVTEDLSTVGNPAESIQFAVRWGDECLVGQVGPATGDPYTAVLPVVGADSCLIGDTRPIDW